MSNNVDRSKQALLEARRLVETSRSRIERTGRLIEEQLRQHTRLDTYYSLLRAAAIPRQVFRKAS